MNPSIYAIISTFVAFVVLMSYYMYIKPDFVLEQSNNPNKKVVSLRISLIYSLLFSSAIGLLVLGVLSILKNYESKQSNYESSYESSYESDNE